MKNLDSYKAFKTTGAALYQLDVDFDKGVITTDQHNKYNSQIIDYYIEQARLNR